MKTLQIHGIDIVFALAIATVVAVIAVFGTQNNDKQTCAATQEQILAKWDGHGQAPILECIER